MAATVDVDVYFDPYDVDITANPYPAMRRLREEAPLYYNERYDFFALSRFDDVERAVMDRDTYISGKGNVLELIKADVQQPPGTLIFEDPPAHTVHRKLLSRAFTPRRLAALEPQIRELTVECLDALVGAGGFDFVADLGAQVPMQVIGMLMGIPREDRQTIREHVDGYLRTEPGKPMKFAKGAKWNPGSKLSAIFGEYIDWRAEHPSDEPADRLDRQGARRPPGPAPAVGGLAGTRAERGGRGASLREPRPDHRPLRRPRRAGPRADRAAWQRDAAARALREP
jgi:cytochrome P450